MSDRPERSPGQTAQQELEADFVRVRLAELRQTPVQGNFDVEHLKAVHARIFQDLPHHRPGVVRDDTYERWTKFRALEGQSSVYAVHYAHENVEARITGILQEFGGPGSLAGLQPDDAASRLAKLYGDLDHAHGFYEGNSRTLREFTRELASAAGYTLDWTRTGVGQNERNTLYVARDVAVLERAFPGLTPERGMETNDRLEYEASLALPGLRRAMGSQSLEAVIRAGLTPQQSMDRGQETIGAATHEAQREAVRQELRGMDSRRLDQAAKGAEMLDGGGPFRRPMTVTDTARLVSPTYAGLADQADALRRESAETDKVIQHYTGIRDYRQAQAGERWHGLGAVRQAGHKTGLRPDDELIRHQQLERLAVDNLGPAEKRRDELAAELPAALSAEAEALEKARPEAERLLADLQERAALAREVIEEQVQAYAARAVNERDIADDNDRGMER
ncbi:MAG: Fic family protein [Acetobacteraceae bacterium]|nr:Fic family protein [Acetobacteraceae bacterium]